MRKFSFLKTIPAVNPAATAAAWSIYSGTLNNVSEDVTEPDTVKDPVTACEPVKYSKLPSNSAKVKADPLVCL